MRQKFRATSVYTRRLSAIPAHDSRHNRLLLGMYRAQARLENPTRRARLNTSLVIMHTNLKLENIFLKFLPYFQMDVLALLAAAETLLLRMVIFLKFAQPRLTARLAMRRCAS